MPTEFVRKIGCYDYHGVALCDSVKLMMAYDGSGRRISKTRMMKTAADGDWYVNNVTHYTGIGTEVREAMRRSASPETKVVVKSLQGESRKNKLACSYDRTAAADAKGVHMPQGLGRYMPEDAVDGLNGVSGSQLAGYRPPAKFEWYFKNHQGESSENVLVHFHCRAAECCALRHNHIGSTMLVYGTSAYSDQLVSGYKDGVKAAYDYRAFGEQVDLTVPAEKVTENFTGMELDDETDLNYFGARYLDPMLGMWTSVDPKRQFSSPYLYVGNGVNPVNGVDEDGNELVSAIASAPVAFYNLYQAEKYSYEHGDSYGKTVLHGLAAFGGTILAAAALGPSSLGGAMAYGAASSAVVNGAEQALFKDEISASEVAEAAWDGAMTSVFSFAGKAAMGTQALGDGFFVIGEAAGATASIPVIKNTPDMSSDSNLNKCQDR